MFRTCYVVAEDNKLYCVDVKLYCVTQINERLNFKFSIGCEHASAGLCIASLLFTFFVVYLFTINIHICVILLPSVASIATRTLTPSHKSPVVRGKTAQTADGNFVVQATGLFFSLSSIHFFGGLRPRGINI